MNIKWCMCHKHAHCMKLVFIVQQNGPSLPWSERATLAAPSAALLLRTRWEQCRWWHICEWIRAWLWEQHSAQRRQERQWALGIVQQDDWQLGRVRAFWRKIGKCSHGSSTYLFMQSAHPITTRGHCCILKKKQLPVSENPDVTGLCWLCLLLFTTPHIPSLGWKKRSGIPNQSF